MIQIVLNLVIGIILAATFQQQNNSNEQMYDNSMGIVLNVDNLDRDSGENKYKRRPLLEWLARFLR